MRIAIQGCSHGSLHSIYSTILASDARTNTKTDLLLLCGDFQAIRNTHDFPSMAVPEKYRQLGDFWEYYKGTRVAPVVTVVIGGNHECMAYMWELFHGGWLAPNIYYLGASGSIYVHPATSSPSPGPGIRIAGLSGIYKSHDYPRGHWERVPFDGGSVKSAYHVREYDVLKLKQLRRRKGGEVDLFMSHDWPVTITRHGDERRLLQQKPFFRDEVKTGTLGSPPALELLNHLAPAYWFAAHLHVKFAALVRHDKLLSGAQAPTGEDAGNPNEIMLDDDEVGNPDEIALDDNDDEEVKVDNPDEIDLNMDDSDAEPAQDVAEKPADQTIAPEPTQSAAIPMESIDQVPTADPEAAKETVHQLVGTEPEQVEKAKEAIAEEESTAPGEGGLETRFLALDKCGFGRDFIQFMDIPTGGPSTGPPRLHFDPEWLTISRAFHPFLPLNRSAIPPTPAQIATAMEEARTYVRENILETPYDVQTLPNGVTLQPLDIEQVQTFCYTAAPHETPEADQATPDQWFTNRQTEAFAGLIGVVNKVNPLPAGAA